ncbi:MAG: flagellar hook-basal body complex protein FliE [Desulfobacteraceae bacterium]|jgi:flagellar hook-basal body complex protein FliE
MSDLIINKTVPPISTPLADPSKAAEPTDGAFGKIIGRAINDVNKQMAEADKAVEALTSGTNKDIHGTMIAMEKASISFHLINQIRNKIIDAYKEVQRMSF